MPTKINASNAVVTAISQAAAIYGVPCFRMQSRTFEVAGAGGRKRPMFIGQWTDGYGTIHRCGMPDLLLQPRVNFWRIVTQGNPGLSSDLKVTVPLWVECKSGSGVLGLNQRAFRDYVVESGAYYLEAHDSADIVVRWFENFGVRDFEK